MRTIDATQLAELLKISINTLRNRRCRTPAGLPPALCIPGQSKLLWLADDVEKWLRGLPVDVHTHQPIPEPGKRKRGRPRKIQVKGGAA